MTTLNSINSKLKSLLTGSGFSALSSSTSTVASSIQALNSSSLGSTLNETISGVQALNTTQASKSVAILTENLTGLQSQVVKDVSGSKSSLDAITGSTVGNGFLDVVITSATAEGVKTGINAIASPSEAQMNNILTNVVPKQYSGLIGSLVDKDFTAFSQDFASSISSFNSSFNNLVGSATGNVLQDIFLKADNSPLSIIENLGVPADETGAILVLLQENKFNEAVRSVVKTTGKPIAEVERELARVPTSLEAQLDNKIKDTPSTGVFDVLSKNNKWNGADTTEDFFDIIPTQEQLQIELIKATREITEIVFFGHESTANQILTANDIHKSYISDIRDGIPFHYVILPNGNLQRGRALAKEGTYSNSHNRFSIGVVIPHVRNVPATFKQGETARMLMETFYEVWPGGQVFDAYADLGTSDVNVGVPIQGILQSLKKINKGSPGRSFSTRQLISAAQGNI